MTDEKFLKRWSKEKLTKTRDRDSGNDIPELVEEQAALPVVPEEIEDGAAAENDPPPDLPPIDSLDAESDYTPFLGENVPEELAQKALRKMWSSDPVFSELDGLNDYDGDYSKLGIVDMAIKTAYKVGKGFLQDEEAKPEDETIEEEGPESEEEVAELSSPDEDSHIPHGDAEKPLKDEGNEAIPHGEKPEH